MRIAGLAGVAWKVQYSTRRGLALQYREKKT
jgi:hypothetical protein